MAEILDIFGIDARLLFIQIVNFGVVVLILWWFLYRPVIRMLDQRNEKIEQSIKDAEEVAEAKEAIEGEKTVVLKEANKEGEEIVERATTHAQQKESEIIKEASERGETIVADARQRGEEERKQLLSESEKEVAQTAILAAEKIMRERA